MSELPLPDGPDTSEATAEALTPEQSEILGLLDAEHGAPVLVRGPRGVGKARLAGFAKQAAMSRPDFAIFEARCPSAGARSFHPYSDIARQAVAWAEQFGLSDSIVDPLSADLNLVIGFSDPDSELEAPSLDQKLAFFESFRRLLRGIATEARLCAIVHDLERADTDTLELTQYLADELFGDPALDPHGPARGLLLLLVREDESTAPDVHDFVIELAETRSVTTLGLQGLDLDGLRSYVQSRHILEKIWTASSGLPREVDALFAALPNNVEELFERRLFQLDSLSREVLEAVTVSGRPSIARQIASVCQQPVKEVARTLSELRAERVLARKIHRGEFQFTFERRRDQEIADRSLSSEKRSQLHSAWARTLSSEQHSAGTALLAYHQLRSNEPQRGVPLAIQAAETHAVAGAVHAAVEILQSALPHATGELRLAILNRLAEVGQLTGNPRQAIRFVTAWKEALAEHERAPALRQEAQLLNTAGEYHRALEVVSEARARTVGLSDEEPIELSRLDATESEALYHLGRLKEAQLGCESGLDRLSSLGSGENTRIRLDLVNQLGKVALADGRPQQAITYFEDTLRSAEQHGLQSEVARSKVNLGIVYLRLGDLTSAQTELEAGVEEARSANEIARLAFGHMSLGTLYHQRSDFGRAISAYRECKSLFRRLGNRTQLARVLHNLGNLYLVAGDLNRSRAHNDEALRLAQSSGVERVVAVATVVDGVILGEEGKTEAAIARLQEGIALHQRLGQERVTEAMLELAELLLHSGSSGDAQQLLLEIRDEVRATENRFLSHRAQLLEGLSQPNPETARKQLEGARDAFHAAGRRLFERDAELGLARAAKTMRRNELARSHLEAARRCQDVVLATIPEELKDGFLSARPQRCLQETADFIQGRAVPSAVAIPRTDSVTERSTDWDERYGSIIGRSAKLMRVFRILDRVSKSEGTVLIFGESGTGKELVAEAIHHNSSRSSGPFVKLNCAALVESLLMSELFGHERGSFTGAHQKKIGRFELAAGGTLFLDEIGDISAKTQVALLRVLQEREFERVGGGQTIEMKARVVCATNRNLAAMVKEGTFREDLYYRLKGINVDLPPLRERQEDIVSLAESFLRSFAKESDSPLRKLAPDACQMLTRYPWPGNIRELENVVRSVALFAENEWVTAQDFDEYSELFAEETTVETPCLAPIDEEVTRDVPRTLRVAPPPIERAPAEWIEAPLPAKHASEEPDLLERIFEKGVPLPELKKQIQNEAISRALRMTDGNITKAADVLGMRRPRLSQIINADDGLKRLTAQGAHGS